MALLPISWEKGGQGSKDSRVQVFYFALPSKLIQGFVLSMGEPRQVALEGFYEDYSGVHR
jgi:hypothetical protein